MQLSIFDITDFANPVLLHKELIGDRGTGSEALYDHKAFSFWAEKDLLAIPVDLLEHQTEPFSVWNSGKHTFTGLYVYKVTVENGFELLGRISTGLATSNTYYYSNEWTRGIFIGDNVYAVQSNWVYFAHIWTIADTVGYAYLGDFDIPFYDQSATEPAPPGTERWKIIVPATREYGSWTAVKNAEGNVSVTGELVSSGVSLPFENVTASVSNGAMSFAAQGEADIGFMSGDSAKYSLNINLIQTKCAYEVNVGLSDIGSVSFSGIAAAKRVSGSGVTTD